MRRILYLMALTLVSAVILLFACNKKDPADSGKKKKKVPSVLVATAVEGKISKTLELVGSISATEIAKMGSPAEGPIIDCKVREGDPVTKGQTLLTIGRKKAADAFVKSAEESLAREREEFYRIEKLVKTGAIPAEQIEIASLRVSRAKAEVSKALESMEDYKVTAPWDGIVRKAFVTDGDFVAPREHLVEIFDPTSLVMQFAVPESKAAAVSKEMKIDIRLDAYPNQKFKGVISRVYPELNIRTRTRTVEAKIFGSDVVELLPGMFARIKLELGAVEKAVLIPEKALVITPTEKQVVFVVEENKAKLRKVVIGLEQDHKVQIISGVKSGEKVVIAGNERLKDGVSVKVVEKKETSSKKKGPINVKDTK